MTLPVKSIRVIQKIKDSLSAQQMPSSEPESVRKSYPSTVQMRHAKHPNGYQRYKQRQGW